MVRLDGFLEIRKSFFHVLCCLGLGATLTVRGSSWARDQTQPQLPLSQQWQCWIFNPLSHQGTVSSVFSKNNSSKLSWCVCVCVCIKLGKVRSEVSLIAPLPEASIQIAHCPDYTTISGQQESLFVFHAACIFHQIYYFKWRLLTKYLKC